MNNIFNNKFLCVPFCVWLAIQIMKFITDWIVNKKPNFKRLVGAGGMPSSHSAFIVSLAVGIGRISGFDSPLFALSFVFAGIVMYDAMGIRRAAGEHAKLLNLILSSDNKFKLDHVKLKELLGHTPFEVLGGLILGILVGVFYPL